MRLHKYLNSCQPDDISVENLRTSMLFTFKSSSFAGSSINIKYLSFIFIPFIPQSLNVTATPFLLHEEACFLSSEILLVK